MKKTELKLSDNNNFFVEEAYKSFRTNLQFCGQDIKVICITSCAENEGKTTLSLKTAKNFSELDRKVLIIDADMRKSVIAGRNANSSSVTGLSEVLSGLVSFDDAVYETQYPGLHLLFSGQFPPNPVELLSSKYFAELIADVREKYDYVIIDTPPLGLVIDAAVVARVSDGAVIAISDLGISRRRAISVRDQLLKSGTRILGAVRNNVKHKGQKKRHYNYGYKYGYSYGYGNNKVKKNG